ncbi:hypothetical protein GLW04_00135 [Halobacillus litoralis]|uniref:Uncharacterized protein n=1 Tax=Halobacillus litoralis TaxID=45668 RepID=A0A845DXT1_9BACI|nr:hypothetical protein [Halobacillus litoralis]
MRQHTSSDKASLQHTSSSIRIMEVNVMNTSDVFELFKLFIDSLHFTAFLVFSIIYVFQHKQKD